MNKRLRPSRTDVTNGRRNVLYIESCQDGTIGGSHTSLLNLIKGIDRARYRPIVVFYERNQLVPEFLAAGVEVHIFRTSYILAFRLGERFLRKGSVLRIAMGALNLPAAAMCKAFNLVNAVILYGMMRSCWFLLRHRVDVVHLNNSFCLGREWTMAAKLLGIKCVSNLMGFARPSAFSRFIASVTDAVLPVSLAVKEDMEGQGAKCKRNIVTYLAIDDSFFVPCPGLDRNRSEVPHRRGTTVGIIGNIKPWKGQKVVIEAVARLTGRHPTIRCLVVGNVPRDADGYVRELQSLIIQENLQDNVLFTGYRQDIPEIVASLDVVIHASIEPEPLGLVIVEGMAMGKPVIATDMGGPRELIKPGVTGILVPPDDPSELARAIDRLLANRAEAVAMGKRAREYAEKHFRIEEYVRRIERIYETLIPCSAWSPIIADHNNLGQ